MAAPAFDLRALDFTIIDLYAAPTAVLDRDGRYVWLNGAAVSVGGYAREEVLGRSYLETMPAETREVVQAAFERAVADGLPAEVEATVTAADGSEVRLHLRLARRLGYLAPTLPQERDLVSERRELRAG